MRENGARERGARTGKNWRERATTGEKGLDPARSGPVFRAVMADTGGSSADRPAAIEAVPGRRPRCRLAWAAAVLLAAGCAYGAVWLLAAGQFRAAALDWIEARAREGYRITYAGLRTGGFPGDVRLTFSEPMIVGRLADAGWTWSADEATAAAGLFEGRRVTVHAPGAQHLDAAAGAQVVRYRGSAAKLEATAEPARVAVRIADLRLAPAAGGGGVAVGRIEATMRGDRAAGGGELALQATGIALPETLDLPFGNAVARLALTATPRGTLDAGRWPETLLAWRDAGGVLDIAGFELAYGPLGIAADGTLALDAAAQPIGAFNARIVGAAPAVDALRDRGLIAERAALAVKALLALVARPPAGGGPPVVEIPLTLQDRTLYAGPLPLAVVPEVRW